MLFDCVLIIFILVHSHVHMHTHAHTHEFEIDNYYFDRDSSIVFSKRTSILCTTFLKVNEKH